MGGNEALKSELERKDTHVAFCALMVESIKIELLDRLDSYQGLKAPCGLTWHSSHLPVLDVVLGQKVEAHDENIFNFQVHFSFWSL